jgi:hypothetical protein
VQADLAYTNVAHLMIPALMRTTPDSMTNYNRLADGVVHFRVTPLDSRGVPLYYELFYDSTFPYGSNVLLRFDETQSETTMLSPVVPAALEIELGILEPQAVERLRSLLTYEARTNFLNRQADKIHFFQQRVSVQSAPKLLPDPAS